MNNLRTMQQQRQSNLLVCTHRCQQVAKNQRANKLTQSCDVFLAHQFSHTLLLLHLLLLHLLFLLFNLAVFLLATTTTPNPGGINA